MASDYAVRWKCSWCGTSATRQKGQRPSPGNCPRRPKTRDGKYKPHVWKKG